MTSGYFTTVNMTNGVFGYVTPCTLVDGSGEICCVYIQGIEVFIVKTEISDSFEKLGMSFQTTRHCIKDDSCSVNVIYSSQSIIKVTKSITIKLVRCVARSGRWRFHKKKVVRKNERCKFEGLDLVGQQKIR
jgi:hypothetical protein